jgi:S1-C subfamily serine protease
VATVVFSDQTPAAFPAWRGLTPARGWRWLLGLTVAAAVISWASPHEPPGPLELAQALSAREDRRLTDVIERAQASTVALEYDARDEAGNRRIATGVVVNDQGDVLSVRINPPAGSKSEPSAQPDVAEWDRSILVVDAAGHRHPARWVASDAETGLTLLHADATDLRPIPPARGEPTLGSEVFVVGNPYGLEHSIGRGHVSGLGRHLRLDRHSLGGLIQVQAPLHPGDSGALLSDLRGGWLGLVRGVGAPDGGPPRAENDLGFAIPARTALWVAEQLRKFRRVDRAYLGVTLGSDTRDGVEVTGVMDQTPASRAGLRTGDRVVKVDGQAIHDSDDLVDQLDRTQAGSEITLELARGASRERVEVRTISRPAEASRIASREGSGSIPPPVARPTEPAPGMTALLERLERLERRVEELERRKVSETP